MVTSRSPRANWYYGWNITGLMVLSQLAASGLPINCFSLFARAWSQEYQVPVSTFATGATVLLLASALLAPAVGWCADRLPVRWLMAAGLGLVALFHVAIGLTTEGWQIVLLFCVLAPFALVLSSNVPAQTLVSRWFVRRRGFALGLSAAGLALGGVAFPPLVVWLLSNFGWRETWSVFGAVIAVLILPVMAVFVRERPGPGDRQDYAPADLTKSHSATLNYRQIAGRRNFWVTVGVVVAVFFVALGVGFNLALIVTSFGFSLNVAGLMLSGWPCEQAGPRPPDRPPGEYSDSARGDRSRLGARP